MRADIEERPRLVNARSPDEGCFAGTCRGQDECTAIARRAPGHREGPADRTQLAGQRELPGEFVFREPVDLELVRGGEDTERNGQIEPAALLGELCRSKIDRDAPRRKFKA